MRGPKSEVRSPKSGNRGQKAGVCSLAAEGVVGLTKAQMAAAIQVCPRTITEMMRRGQISYWKIGRLVRFRMEDAVKRMNETVLVTAEEGEE
jgi:excisionase family DNA binding protein